MKKIFNQYTIYNGDKVVSLISINDDLSNILFERINKLYGLINIIDECLTYNNINDTILSLNDPISSADVISRIDDAYNINAIIYDDSFNIVQAFNDEGIVSKTINLLNVYKEKSDTLLNETKQKLETLKQSINNNINLILNSNQKLSVQFQNKIYEANNLIDENTPEEISNLFANKEFKYIDASKFYSFKNKFIEILGQTTSEKQNTTKQSYVIVIGSNDIIDNINRLRSTINSIYNNLYNYDLISAISIYREIISTFIDTYVENKSQTLNDIIANNGSYNHASDAVRSIVETFMENISFDEDYEYTEDDENQILNYIGNFSDIISSIHESNESNVSEIISKIKEYNSLVETYNSKHEDKFDLLSLDGNKYNKTDNNSVNNNVNNITNILNKALEEVNQIYLNADNNSVYPGDVVNISVIYYPELHKPLNIDNLNVSFDENIFELISKQLDTIIVKVNPNAPYETYDINVSYNDVFNSCQINVNENVQPQTMYFYYGNDDSILNENSINYNLAESLTESEVFNEDNSIRTLEGSLNNPIKYLLIKSSYVDNNQVRIINDVNMIIDSGESNVYKDEEYTLITFTGHNNGAGLVANVKLTNGNYDSSIISQYANIIELTSEEEPANEYFSIGTTEVTASNYTTANDATTIIPTTMEYTSSQRTYHYILIPSNKTLTMVDKNLNLPIPMTEQTSAGINGHKLYETNGAIAVGATVIITLS